MPDSYKEKILNIYNTFIQDIKTNSEYTRLTQKQFEMYGSIIKDFFVGKESEIKNIYNSIRNNSFPYNKVECIDINNAMNLYKDYFEGMWEFVNKVCDLRDTDDVKIDNIISTITKVNDKDKEFISSILGGDRNPSQVVTLDDAMKNVECLIDIDSKLQNYIKLIDTLCCKTNTLQTQKYNEQINNGICVVITSIGFFISRCMEEIIATYDRIIKSMTSRVPSTGTPEVPEYQMF